MPRSRSAIGFPAVRVMTRRIMNPRAILRSTAIPTVLPVANPRA
jgi:hypothetical protein